MTPVDRPTIFLASVVLGARDPGRLARFYSDLLGWPIAVDQGDWLIVREPNGGTGLSFQLEPDHMAPVWPAQPGAQRMALHLDIATSDIAAAEQLAVSLGAAVAAHQPQPDVRVLTDPEGHLFCLFPSG